MISTKSRHQIQATSTTECPFSSSSSSVNLIHDSVQLRRFDRSSTRRLPPRRGHGHPPSHIVTDEELKPLLWDMFHLTCIDGLSLETVRDNLLLSRYVENMFNTYDDDDDDFYIKFIGDSDDDDDYDKVTRLGVIADWTTKTVGLTTSSSKGNSKDDNINSNGMMITPGVGAAWIQCWNPKTSKLMADLKGRLGDGHHPELTMAVLPEYQGRGIGKRMLQDLIEYAQEKKVPAIRLRVNANDLRSQGLYRQFGFEIVKGTVLHDSKGIDYSIAMLRWL